MEQQIRQERMRQILKGMTRDGWLLESCLHTAIFKDDFAGHLDAFFQANNLQGEINLSQLIQFNSENYVLGGGHGRVGEFLESCIEIYGKTIFSREELEDIQLMITEYLDSGAGYNALHEE